MTLLQMIGLDDGTWQEPGSDPFITGYIGGRANGGADGGLAAGMASVAGSHFFALAAPVTNTMVIGFGWYPNQGLTTFKIMEVYDSDNTHLHLTLKSNSNGRLDILGPTGAVIASSAVGALHLQAWHYIEFKFKIHDSTGLAEVRINEDVVATFSGDTRNAGNGDIGSIAWYGNNGFNAYYDDIYCLDSAGSAPFNDYLGDVVIRPLVPNADGASSQWLGSDGNSVNNYQQVDEQNSTMSDYNAGGTTGLTDLYNVTNLRTNDVPYAYKLFGYANKSDGGTPPVVKMLARGASGGDQEESAMALSTTALSFVGAIRTVDPDGNALTESRVNAMQIGVRTS